MNRMTLFALLSICYLGACASSSDEGSTPSDNTLVRIRDASVTNAPAIPTDNGASSTTNQDGVNNNEPTAGEPTAGGASSDTGQPMTNIPPNPPIAASPGQPMGEQPDVGGGPVNGGMPSGTIMPTAGVPSTAGASAVESAGETADESAGMPVSGGMPMPAAGVAAPVGGAPLAPQDNNVFGPSNGVLAQLEMNGTLEDSSGSNRPGARVGLEAGRYVATSFGQGLTVSNGTNAFDWTYAVNDGLQAPFTIEIIMVNTRFDGGWGKVVGHEPSDWTGIWLDDQGDLELWTDDVNEEWSIDLGGPRSFDGRVYLAVRSTADNRLESFWNGRSVGVSEESDGLALPNQRLMFFQDGHPANRNDNLSATIEAVRISNVARTNEEITAIQARLDTRQP